ncbi:hypothetical protein BC835DRAFT_1305346 [Cytidiella melzeri]|nr:hypothetical protein BC835DRAFT_1305346 [Cytidiella melzeri]
MSHVPIVPLESLGGQRCFHPFSDELWSDLQSSGVLPTVHANALTSQSSAQPERTLIKLPRAENSSRTQHEFIGYPAIEFWVDGRQGVRLLDALQGDLTGLAGCVVEVMHSSSAKVSYRIEWPGYSSFTRQKYARRVRGLQDRSKIARQVAEVVNEFMSDRARYVPAQPGWRVGRGFIEYGQVYLLELRRISRSTWVPVLAYAV